jgi:replicative DNA helicase
MGAVSVTEYEIEDTSPAEVSTEDEVTTTVATLGQYGKTFQEKTVQALFADRQWASEMIEVMTHEHFELKYLRYLVERYFSHYRKYKTFPTLPLLITIVADELRTTVDIAMRDNVIDYVQRIKQNPDPSDLAYVKDKSRDFCKKQALKSALEKAVDLMDVDKYESIVDVVKRAVVVGSPSSLGHDLIEDMDSRFVAMKRECICTGMPELDAKGVLNGGLGRGEIIVIIAPSGAGKSHFMTFFGANALKQKKNVLHFTFELSAEQIGLRYDANLTGIACDDIIENKDVVKQYYAENAASLGSLKIASYPPNTASVFTLRSHIERLALKGFVPDVIIVDYADIMRSTRQYDALRHELALIYQELRGLAVEQRVPVITASQSNRDGSNADVIDLTNMSESYSKAFITDVVISLSRKSAEKSLGTGRMFIAKNRAGRDGLLWNVSIDTAHSKFAVVGENVTPEMVRQSDEEDMKSKLRAKWKEMSDEGVKLETLAGEKR